MFLKPVRSDVQLACDLKVELLRAPARGARATPSSGAVASFVTYNHVARSACAPPREQREDCLHEHKQ